MRRDHLPGRGGPLTIGPRWRLAEPADADTARSLADALGLPLPLAALLVQRGHVDPDAVKAFLRPRIEAVADPFTLAGMTDAVEQIVTAVGRGDRILVHGDYDVDGQCATAVMTRSLRMAGADVVPFLPNRLSDGYDFGAAGLAAAHDIGARLVITCDCGITALDAVAAARAAGLAVVITDHHLPGPALPAASAVVDPQRPDDQSGLGMLCGTGLVFKLVQALVAPLGLPQALPHHLLDYVALATVADVVPLIGENRVLVKYGLRVLGESRWAGLRALVARAGIENRPLRASQVGFVLAPRLNAVGRIADANDGLRLLLSDDEAEAAALADRLDRLNRERQAIDQRVLDAAIELVEREYHDPVAHRALVLADDGWHPGVVGIVASRLVERYGRPTFLIGLDGDSGRGSGRSVDGFDLHAALVACAELLDRYGGHRMAGGVTIRRDRIDGFRDRFNAVARERIPADEVGPTQRVDLEVTLDQITDELERWGRHLEPCGMGNPAAVFGVRNVRLENPRVVGSNHLKGVLAADGCRLDAIAFGWADRFAEHQALLVDAAFRLERNEWQGRSTLQARTLALAPAEA